MDIREIVVNARRKKKMKQINLAMELGYSASHWSQIEIGKSKVLEEPSPFLLEDIAHVLDLSYVDLMYRAGYMDSFPRDHRIVLQENEDLKREIKELKKKAG